MVVNKLKKIATVAITSMALSFTVPMIATGATVVTPHDYNNEDNSPYFDDSNSICCPGNIISIKKSKKGGYRKVTVKMYGDVPILDGQKYSIILSAYEWKSWKKEQGKIKKGQDVICCLYDNNSPYDVTDDIIINIRKWGD